MLFNLMKYATKEANKMTVYVTVELFQGVISNIQVFLTQKSTQKIEQKWLREYDISNDIDRECKSQNGTELIIETCTLRL